MRLRFSNQQPIPISEGAPSTIASRIDISGVTGEVVDVDVIVDVDHSFTDDLEITLIGPNGSRVVLVGNEGGSDNDFAQTTFDDEALQPITSAHAPFTGRFRPEQSLSGFDHSDPNGTWTLEITDRAWVDGGQLTRWFLDLEVASTQEDVRVFETQVPATILAGPPNTVMSTIYVSGMTDRVLERIEVMVDIEHTYARDLTLILIAPTGQRVLLADREGGSDNNFERTVFADDAPTAITSGSPPYRGRFRPKGALTSLRGLPVAGAWRLEVRDNARDDGGQLSAWSVLLETRAVERTSQFQIEVRFLGGLTATQRAVFEDAARRWSEIIVGDLPAAIVEGTEIDDVLIFARGEPIDGGGSGGSNILGQAAPLRVRSGSFLPALGLMSFDTFDLGAMEADGSLFDVIVHEMGHVLGIGTTWQDQGLLLGAGGPNPVFTGQRAMQEFANLRGASDLVPVPVANQGGLGTRDGHWRESTFFNELMTGIINSGVVNPLSRLTAAALADMGYEVDLTAAENYALPAPGPSIVAAPGRQCCGLHEITYEVG